MNSHKFPAILVWKFGNSIGFSSIAMYACQKHMIFIKLNGSCRFGRPMACKPRPCPRCVELPEIRGEDVKKHKDEGCIYPPKWWFNQETWEYICLGCRTIYTGNTNICRWRPEFAAFLCHISIPFLHCFPFTNPSNTHVLRMEPINCIGLSKTTIKNDGIKPSMACNIM